MHIYVVTEVKRVKEDEGFELDFDIIGAYRNKGKAYDVISEHSSVNHYYDIVTIRLD